MEPLYKIDNRILSLVNSPDPVTGEIDMEALTQLELDQELKQQNVALYIKTTELQADVIDHEIKRLKAMKEAAERRVDWLKQYLQRSMELADVTELSFGVHTLKIKNNPPSVVVYNEELLEPEFKTQVITTKVDKLAIKKAIQAGKEVSGAELVQSKRLDIK